MLVGGEKLIVCKMCNAHNLSISHDFGNKTSNESYALSVMELEGLDIF